MVYLVTLEKTLFEVTEYKIISVEESLQLLKGCKRLQYDSETTGLDPHINQLLCIQFGSKEKDFQIVVDCSCIDITIYKDILENTLLIGHNLKFDLQFLYNHNIIPRKVYDTMIVEQLLFLGTPKIDFTLEEYEKYNYEFPITLSKNKKGEVKLDKYGNNLYHISYSLNSVAKKRLNIDIDKTVRGQIIWRGLDVQTILYAANDVVYLEDIFQLQIQDCKKKKCLIGAKLECDFVPAISYLEWCGIKLDENKWKSKMESDLINYNNAKTELNNYIFNKSLENNNTGKILKKYVYIDRQMDLFEGYDLSPKCSINWDSSKQVIPIAKLLGFDTAIQDKQTGEDKESVLEKHLISQKGIDDNFLKYYFNYREYAKVVSSFGQGHIDSINPITGRLHTTFRQLGATSGRLSCGSKDPNEALSTYKKLPKGSCKYFNLQQLPSDEQTRSSFVAPEGYKMVSADFSAEESRLGADIYQDKEMLKEFLEGSGDMHSLFAWMVFRKECEELGCTCVADIKSKAPKWRKEVKAVELSHADSY